MPRRAQSAGMSIVILVALPLLVFGMVSFARRIGGADPELGIEWIQASTGAVAVAVDPAGPAGRAGLQVGDLLVGIDGRPIANALDAARVPWDNGSETPLAFGVRRGGESLTVVVRPEWRSRSEPYTYLAIVGLAFWVSGRVHRAPLARDPRRDDLRRAGALLLRPADAEPHRARRRAGLDRLLGRSGRGLARAGPADPPRPVAVQAGRAAPPGRARRLVRRRWRSRSSRRSGCVPRGRVEPTCSPNRCRVVDLRESFEPLWLSLAWLLTIALLVRSYGRSSSVTHRSQMRWMLWGLGGGLGPFILLYAVPWALGAPELPAGPASSRWLRCCSCPRRSPRRWRATGCTTWT